jgi:glycosyl transferase family 1
MVDLFDSRLPIYFYIPHSEVYHGDLPTTETYWLWLSSQKPQAWGKFNWTLQTYLYLNRQGFQCELTRRLPSEGIVIAHRDFFTRDLQPGPRLLMVCLLADRTPHPYAQFHVIQNRLQSSIFRPKKLWPTYYIPHWPQPGLIPRNPGRGDRFETAAFFGHADNIAGELREPAWNARLRDLGLSWWLVPQRNWHDYSAVDVVVAIRSFKKQEYLYKPPSKLFNAWHAGVPAILGRESAYRAARRSDLDYLEASSVEGAVAALKQLRDERDLRRAMAENGRRRAKDVHAARFTKRWQSLFANELVAKYTEWCHASANARAIFLERRASSFPSRQTLSLLVGAVKAPH